MTFIQSLNYLNSFLNYEHITTPSPKRAWNLERMRHLTKMFDRPEESFVPILIAGTKGKGSTGFFLESMLVESKVKVGFYNSPHLIDPRERIRFNGHMVTQNVWARELTQIRRKLSVANWPKRLGKPTYFEVMTLLAMLIFKRLKVKIGIFEIGLGGRLDATNVMDAPLVVLTPVHFDHEAFLGNTLTEIAGEKAAIIRRKATVVMSPQRQECEKVIQNQVRRKRATLIRAKPISERLLSLEGDFQKMNAGAALAAVRWLEQRMGLPVTDKAVKRGLSRKRWQGRFQNVKGKPNYLLDVAHNPASTEALVRNLKSRYKKTKKTLIFGVSQDKNLKEMFRILGSHFEDVILTEVANPRTQRMDVLVRDASKSFGTILPASNLHKAFRLANQRVGEKGLVVVTGSFYLVGEAKKRISANG